VKHAYDKLKVCLSFVSGLVLVVASGLVIFSTQDAPPSKFHGKVQEFLPEVPGWIREERPIAETEEMRKAVGSILNYDQGVLMHYTRGGTRLMAYVAYWSPGKMNYREVASHTPDVCWIEAGWQRKAMGLTPSLAAIDGRRLPSGEARTFEINGRPEYVWFWHVIGDRTHFYRTGSKPAWHATLFDSFRWGLRQQEEQFFIRISANEPLENLLRDPLLLTILSKLPLSPSRSEADAPKT
jgi:hypothetical protein